MHITTSTMIPSHESVTVTAVLRLRLTGHNNLKLLVACVTVARPWAPGLSIMIQVTVLAHQQVAHCVNYRISA